MRRAQDFNTGIYDGEVGHAETNSALAEADLAVLVGEQRRQAHFAVDRRLPKLHAGDPRVLAFWQAFALVPATYREAFWQMGACAVLCRGAAAVFYHDRRRHQALHVGRRRRTLYLAEGLFNSLVEDSEGNDSSSWALAAGLVQAICQLSDYVLLSALVGYDRIAPTGHALGAGDLPVLRRLVVEAPVPRKADEIEAFATAYQQAITQLAPQPDSRADEEKALDLWDGAFEAAWAGARERRLREYHAFPADSDFDRDLAHPLAARTALELGEAMAPRTFAEVLHDYRDASRFFARPPTVDWGRAHLPKPQADFLHSTVRLAPAGLTDFFAAYGDGCAEAVELIHPLWSYICRLSSDPAGVYALFGHCRALAVAGKVHTAPAKLAENVAGICCRLDQADGYAETVERLKQCGEAGRRAFAGAVGQLDLQAEDEWAPFKARKQGIVAVARQALEDMQGHAGAQPNLWQRRAALHADPAVRQILDAAPHRHSSDPVGVLVCRRAYQRQLEAHGPADAEASALLAALLVRFDRAPDYPRFLEQISVLGAPAISALFHVVETIGPEDENRRPIYNAAHRQLGLALLRYRARRKKRA